MPRGWAAAEAGVGGGCAVFEVGDKVTNNSFTDNSFTDESPTIRSPTTALPRPAQVFEAAHVRAGVRAPQDAKMGAWKTFTTLQRN